VGKTELAAEIGSWRPRVRFAALTGKAVNVLEQRGCRPASTLHRLLYHATYDYHSDTYHFTRRTRDEAIDLLIVDEASMINSQLGKDIRSLGVPTLILADPFQLPPITGEGFFMGRKPDVMLTQIHRQARDNPIIAFADAIRRGKHHLRPQDSIGDEVQIINGRHDHPEEFDAVLCGRNRTRHKVNAEVRRARGFSGPIPQVGETVCCLRNDYSVHEAVLNGSTWEVVGSQLLGRKVVELELQAPDSASFVRAPVRCFGQDHSPVDREEGLQDFDFGYCLTVHKAQGSEWDDVLVIDERFCFPNAKQRWLYTAVTRARETLTIELPR